MIKQGMYKTNFTIKSTINPNPLLLDTVKLDDVLKLKILSIRATNPISNRKLIMLTIWTVVEGIDMILDNA